MTSEDPVAADRPFVDGAAASADELRAEVEHEQVVDSEQVAHVAALREEVGGTVAELRARADVPSRARAWVAATGEHARARGIDAMRRVPRAGWAAAAVAAFVLIRLVRRRRAIAAD